MKRVIIVFLAVIMVFSFATTFIRMNEQQRDAMENAAASTGEAFVIPVNSQLSDPKTIYQALLASAKQSQTNVFRTQSTTDGQVVQYVLLTNNNTNFYSFFSLSSGHFLTASESASDQYYLSTTPGGSGETGVIRDLGENDSVQIRGLKAAWDSLPTSGIYFAESASGTADTTFLNQLALQLSSATGAKFTSSDFVYTNNVGGFSERNPASLLSVAYYLCLLLLVILLAYRQLYETKRLAVMRLHGHGVVKIWFLTSGRLILLTSGVTGVLVVLASLFTPGSAVDFVMAVVESSVISLFSGLAVSLVTCFHIMNINASTAIKNRKDTRWLFNFNVAIKGIVAVVLIITGTSLCQQYTQAQHDKSTLGNWSATSQYAIFYPTSVGNDWTDIRAGLPGPANAEDNNLYSYLNGKGALYVDATEYEPTVPGEGFAQGFYRSMEVNPNYLDKYPILSASGTRVRVAESTTQWVVLVPVQYRNQEAKILKFFQEGRSGDGNHPALAKGSTQEVSLIWIENGQDVFSFDPLIDPDHGSVIRDPIIEVMTASNSTVNDRGNAITGGANGALKVYIGNTPASHYLKSIEPFLKSLHINENLPYLVTLDGYVDSQTAMLNQGIDSIMIVGGALLLVMVFLILQSLSISFERFARKVAVRKLFGYSIVRRYRELFMILGLVWCVQLLISLAFTAAGVSPLPTGTGPSAVTLAVSAVLALALAGVEMLVSSVVLFWIERRRFVSVLKGEF